MLTLISLFIAGVIVIVFRFINTDRKPPILGVYQQANKFYWFKFIYMLVLLNIKQVYLYLRRRIAVELGASDDGTSRVHIEDEALEAAHALKSHPLAADGVYFNGTSKTGAALVCNVTRRKDGKCDAFLYLKVEGGQLLLSPKLPDSDLQQTSDEEGQYIVEGLNIKNVIPMRTWSIQYDGQMKLSQQPSALTPVSLSVTWSTCFPPFLLGDMSPRALAADLAREPWSAEYLDMVKRFKQQHYEQMGFLEGSAVVGGVRHELVLSCVRDHHTSPHLDWRNIHRYVHHFIYLENGDCVGVGSASTLTVSHVTIGYLCKKKSQKVYPVSSCDFVLYQHGEQQILPEQYGFSFNVGCKSYAVQVQVTDQTTHYIGEQREAKFYERWCSYEVDGVKGWGCAEWHYNNVMGPRE